MHRFAPLILVLFILVSSMPLPILVRGATGIAIGGSFYRFSYLAAQGQIIEGPDIYVIVFNKGNEELNVSMEYDIKPQTPFIRIVFSKPSFVLRPGESEKVYVRIEVGADAVPGNYTIGVVAKVWIKPEGSGSIAVPAAAQYSNLTVTGESSTVKVITVDRSGRPVPCYIRLFLITPTGNFTVTESETGVLEAVVAPGTYVAAAYIAGTLLNSTTIVLRPGEYREVTIVVSTVYFEYFYVSPALDKEGRIGYALVIGVVQNLFRPLPNTTIVLEVSYNGSPYEEVVVSSLSEFPKGRSEYRHSYIPKDGWRVGTYGFRMRLISEGIVYAETEEKRLVINKSMLPLPAPAPAGLPAWALPLAAGLSIPVALAVAVIIMRRRRAIVLAGWEYSAGYLTLTFRNRGRTEVRFHEVTVRTKKEVLTSVTQPRLAPHKGPVLPPGSEGVVKVRDRRGVIEEALRSGRVYVDIITSVGRARYRLK